MGFIVLHAGGMSLSLNGPAFHDSTQGAPDLERRVPGYPNGRGLRCRSADMRVGAAGGAV